MCWPRARSGRLRRLLFPLLSVYALKTVSKIVYSNTRCLEWMWSSLMSRSCFIFIWEVRYRCGTTYWWSALKGGAPSFAIHAWWCYYFRQKSRFCCVSIACPVCLLRLGSGRVKLWRWNNKLPSLSHSICSWCLVSCLMEISDDVWGYIYLYIILGFWGPVVPYF